MPEVLSLSKKEMKRVKKALKDLLIEAIVSGEAVYNPTELTFAYQIHEVDCEDWSIPTEFQNSEIKARVKNLKLRKFQTEVAINRPQR
jgi:hypothetical protein